MSSWYPPAPRNAATPTPGLAGRLASYARECGLRFAEHAQSYELEWFHGDVRYFIEIDKVTSAVRTGVDAGEAVRYDAPTYLGTSRLEDLLDRQRELVDHD